MSGARDPAAAGRASVAPPIHTEADLTEALAALRERDPEVVDRLLGIGGRPPLRRRAAGFDGLAAIVVGQQLSTASAGAILARLSALVSPLEAEGLARVDDAELRRCGLSIQKIATLRAIAGAITAGDLQLDDLAGQPAEEATRRLVSVKGIGPWTAEIFLLTCLGHADAWPAGDLALQEAVRFMLALPARPGTAEMIRIGERWRPWRAVAARLLWSVYRATNRGRDGLVVGADAAR